MEAVPGYLSLHQSAENLTLKWTPNQLMNGTLGDSELEKRWGLWDSLPGAREGSEGLPPGRGVERRSLLQEAGLTPHSMPRIAELLPGEIAKLSKIQPGLGTERFA